MSERAPGNSARPLIAAGVLFLDEEDRVLLVNPSYKQGWEIPGGYVEAGESPLEASIREVKEELGIAPPIGAPLVIDWAPHPGQGDKLLFIFDGGILAPGQREQVRLAEDELTDWQFYGSRELNGVLIPRLARRVQQAIDARQSGQARYLQHGALV